jgi:hypothetical protein
MAQMRFFKKFSPENHPVMANGSKIQFDTIDGIIAYHASLNPDVIAELERFMREQRYGLTEITAEEFVRDYRDAKKNSGEEKFLGNWREEMGKGKSTLTSPIQRLGVERVNAVVGLDETKKPAPVPATVADAPKADPPKPEFKPTVGKRVKKLEPKATLS